MLVAELRQPRHQPAHREGGGGGHLQRPGGVGPGQLVDGAADVAEAGLERGGELDALGGQHRAASLAAEKRHPERLLERPDPLADRGVAHVQRRAGTREAAGLGQRREGAQRAERGHRPPVHA